MCFIDACTHAHSWTKSIQNGTGQWQMLSAVLSQKRTPLLSRRRLLLQKRISSLSNCISSATTTSCPRPCGYREWHKQHTEGGTEITALCFQTTQWGVCKLKFWQGQSMVMNTESTLTLFESSKRSVLVKIERWHIPRMTGENSKMFFLT